MMWDQDSAGGSMLGQRLNSFRIESRLGAGSLGIVYRAVNEDTGETVAIKVARDVRQTGPERLLHSGQMLARFDHDNIVRVMAIGQDYGTTFLVMEFIPGPTLASTLAERGALPWPEVVGLGLQICDALEHMHDRGVLHRNIKPAHLILNEDYQLKLVGFGLATAVDEEQHAGEEVAVGTPGFMAPEQICGSRAMTPAIDLYALGVVLWNLLTGERPYQELSGMAQRRGGAALAFMHLTQPPPRPSTRIMHIPMALDDLVVHLMDRNPENRPGDAAAVARVLLHC
jgi:eukaryotic-like serine/threonine-protein kinase